MLSLRITIMIAVIFLLLNRLIICIAIFVFISFTENAVSDMLADDMLTIIPHHLTLGFVNCELGEQNLPKPCELLTLGQ